ncbi:MAG: metallophosphoesterase family protein [Myxococcales bacterium]|nr:metallophosphoesterase family protein [Myxococcales bacterium]
MHEPRLGLISDTHGVLRPSARRALEGCELILHAGDVGGIEIIESLSAIAPTHAVRGNTDQGAWAAALPESEWVEWRGLSIYLIHDLADLDIDPRAAGVAIVLSGHTHQPRFVVEDGVHYWNPGSAGPRRFRLPIGLAIATLAGDVPSATWVDVSE